ncbi:universal stress protein [Lactiplantibacillus plantarum]|uniref:universal stress protein n=1 Tax=Lactiplantibacillus plantarum TaxID=1590 RepID=UPI00189942EA|nr:universal stress protein [Lactiplantibacillus plantarum]MDB7774385.1 universal stress protein [Lactiplantibacillus plantarum]
MRNGNVILVAIDNHISAFKITQYAIELANALDKSLYFVHILDDSSPKYKRNPRNPWERSNLDALSEFYLKDCANMALDTNVNHVFHSLIYGRTKNTLVRLSNMKNVALTIVGASGYDDLYNNRIGHIAQYVSCWSKGTVTIVR